MSLLTASSNAGCWLQSRDSAQTHPLHNPCGDAPSAQPLCKRTLCTTLRPTLPLAPKTKVAFSRGKGATAAGRQAHAFKWQGAMAGVGNGHATLRNSRWLKQQIFMQLRVTRVHSRALHTCECESHMRVSS